jgi:hypothetical protein
MADLLARLTSAVIRVGDGRGFIVKDRDGEHIVITAGHCLPSCPRCYATSGLEERTYEALLGPLGQEPTVWTECLFVDPIGDIAVLGPPSHEDLYNQHHAYVAWVEAVTPLPITDAPKNRLEKRPGRGRGRWHPEVDGAAQLLSLDGRWFACRVSHSGGSFWIHDAVDGIVGGMSGSPILAEDGSVIGVVSVSGGTGTEVHTEGGPNPRLAYHLPARFLPRFR